MIETVLELNRIADNKKEEMVQLAMFIFHSQAKIVTYHQFDRFVYAQAAILLSGKIIDMLDSPENIVKEFRKALRKVHKREGTDNEARIAIEVKKVIEAETNLMINIGFDLNLFAGITWLYKWDKMLSDSHFSRSAARQITRLYKTSVVIYFEPEELALTGIMMAVRESELTAEISGWKP